MKNLFILLSTVALLSCNNSAEQKVETPVVDSVKVEAVEQVAPEEVLTPTVATTVVPTTTAVVPAVK